MNWLPGWWTFVPNGPPILTRLARAIVRSLFRRRLDKRWSDQW